MHPHLAFELTRQRMAEAEQAARREAARREAARRDDARRSAPARRSSFVLVRTSPAVRVVRRLRPETGEP